jgi:hypothetical protein
MKKMGTLLLAVVLAVSFSGVSFAGEAKKAEEKAVPAIPAAPAAPEKAACCTGVAPASAMW